MLRETDRDREVGDDGIFRIIFTRIGVEPGREVDCEDKRIFFPAQAIDLTGGGAKGFAQK